jgi:hypothetical protein
MAKAVGCLLCKFKGLSSDPSPTKQTNKQKKNYKLPEERWHLSAQCHSSIIMETTHGQLCTVTMEHFPGFSTDFSSGSHFQ